VQFEFLLVLSTILIAARQTLALAELHPEVVFENISGGNVTHLTTGKAAFSEQANDSIKLFSSRTQTINKISDEPEALTAMIDFSA
jgi:hypothetical protein